MLVQLTINDVEFPAFKNIIEHLKDGMVEHVSVLDPGEASFVMSSEQVVRERVQQAETRGSYTDHDTFWDGLTVDSK